jgi:hypothetical protein
VPKGAWWLDEKLSFLIELVYEPGPTFGPTVGLVVWNVSSLGSSLITKDILIIYNKLLLYIIHGDTTRRTSSLINKPVAETVFHLQE